MNNTDKQVMAALIYIKNNLNCTTRSTDLNEDITHYLYESNLVDGHNTLSSSSDKGAKHEYSFLKITTQGEMYIESHKKQNSLLNIFNNKTVRYVIAATFAALLATVSAICVFNYQQSHEQSNQSKDKDVHVNKKATSNK